MASAAVTTTTSVPTPPPTTANTGDVTEASQPDSNSPSSFDALINMPLIAETRPRIWSGVSICTSVCRTTTLMQSKAPVRTNASNESQNEVDSPNTIIAAPKPATAQSNVWPAFFI